jgi:hypothetical protein
MSLAIWNHGSRPCTVRGWAAVQFLNAVGGLVRTRWVASTTTFSGGVRPNAVSLVPCGGSNPCPTSAPPEAFINFAGDDVIQPCVTAAKVRVLTPGATIPVVANLSVQGFAGGQVICSDGEIFVLPVQPAVGALEPAFS